MPNPFPGMDPYLEGPMWSTVHSNLIEQIGWQLAPRLRPKYRAFTNTHIIMASLDPLEFPRGRLRLPDVGIYEKGTLATTGPAATAIAPLKFMAVMPETIEQKVLEIRESESDALVAAIEVLSPTNKRGDGLIEFSQKRREYLAGSAHYLEIDLLRIGKRFPVTNTLPSVPYFVFLSRADQRPCLETWPIALDQSLPKVPVPLLDDDPDIELDLQLAWSSIFEHYGYDALANHSGKPLVPLSAEQQAWADERLRAVGMKN